MRKINFVVICMVTFLVCLLYSAEVHADNSQQNRIYISYEGNNGDGAPAQQQGIKGESLQLSSQVPTRNGYDFMGWATDRDASEPMYQAGERYVFYDSQTLYAVWEEQFYVRYYVDKKLVYQEIVHGGDEVSVIDYVPEERLGWRFTGWYASGLKHKKTLYKAGEKVLVFENVYFQAGWESRHILKYVKIKQAKRFSNTVQIKWKKNKGLQGYYIYFSNKKNFKKKTIARVGKKKSSIILKPKEYKKMKKKLGKVKYVKVIGWKKKRGTTHFTVPVKNVSIKKIL